MLRAERRRKNAICHRPERRMDRASAGIDSLRMALRAVLMEIVNRGNSLWGFGAQSHPALRTMLAKAGVRSGLCVRFVWLFLAIGGLGGMPSAVLGQQKSGGPGVAPESKQVQPKRGRDNDYTATEMTKRLIALAEGPIPSRESLETEFGFEFELRTTDKDGSTYWGRAGQPFLPVSSDDFPNIVYDAWFRATNLTLKFLGYSPAQGFPKYCIPTDSFIKALTAKWQRHVVRHGHFPAQVFYTTTMQGISRKLTLAPNHFQGDGCISLFSIGYVTEEVYKGNQ